MLKGSKRVKAGKFRSGNVMVILGIIIVLGVVLFLLNKTGLLTGVPGDPNESGIKPWKEFEIRQKLVEMESPKIELAEPEISETYQCLVQVPDTKDGRGRLTIIVNNGGVSGFWGGTYHNSNKRAVQIMGSEFNGQCYGDHIWDENGNEDTSKNYYICKGGFMFQEEGKQMVKHRAGDIYLRFWLDKDEKVVGKMYLTSDEKKCHEYVFRGNPRRKGMDLVF